MTVFMCDYGDCMYNDSFEGKCTKELLSSVYFWGTTDEDVPDCFESFLNMPEYQSEFWIAKKTNNGERRARRKGKKLEVNGLTLYTRDRVPPLEDCKRHIELAHSIFCTEEKTGYAVELAFVLEHSEQVWEFVQKTPPVMAKPPEEVLE